MSWGISHLLALLIGFCLDLLLGVRFCAAGLWLRFSKSGVFVRRGARYSSFSPIQ